MVVLNLTENQLQMLYTTLDTELKTHGLTSLVMAVDLYNALQKAEKVTKAEAATKEE